MPTSAPQWLGVQLQLKRKVGRGVLRAALSASFDICPVPSALHLEHSYVDPNVLTKIAWDRRSQCGLEIRSRCG